VKFHHTLKITCRFCFCYCYVNSNKLKYQSRDIFDKEQKEQGKRLCNPSGAVIFCFSFFPTFLTSYKIFISITFILTFH